MNVLPQAPLMAPSSQSEDVLDLEHVPPPIQRVIDPGRLTCPQFQLFSFLGFNMHFMY